MDTDYNKLNKEERDTLINLLIKVGEYHWVYEKFKDKLTIEQKMNLMKKTNSTNIRADIASNSNITEEQAYELHKASKYSYFIKWTLMRNENLNIDFRKKFLTRGMINAVISETDRRNNTKRWYPRKGMNIHDVKTLLPADIWPYVSKRFEDAKAVKDIIV